MNFCIYTAIESTLNIDSQIMLHAGDYVHACQISAHQISYMQDEASRSYSIGYVEFRSPTRPVAGDWVVYHKYQPAFVMSDEQFKSLYKRKV
jgi:Rps23 Pro-64 3,4-dihydroxylase Tpa1-like proline 4-hydroxylase